MPASIAVFTKDGTLRQPGNGDYQVYYPHPGWAEQNPEEWWEAVCNAIPKVLAKGNISPEEIKGIGIDGQSWSAIAVDKDGNVLTNTPIWMDTRATDICEEFNEKIGKDKVFELCGNSLQPVLYNCKDYLVSEKPAGSLCKDCIRSFNPTVTLYTN